MSPRRPRPSGRTRSAARPGTPGAGSRRTGRRTGAARTHTERSSATREPARSTAGAGSAGSGSATSPPQGRRRRSSLTTRAIALGVVLLVLTISYASSLRVYFDQRREMAESRVAIARHQQAINDLNTEIDRWKDPAFVKRQARQQLGWVVPGETGYKVIGPDGKPVGPGARINGANRPDDSESEAWWAKLFGTMAAADHPAPGQQGGPTSAPSGSPTVGPTTKPTG